MVGPGVPGSAAGALGHSLVDAAGRSGGLRLLCKALPLVDCRRRTKSAIYRAIKSGRLPASKLNGGGYAIYPAELLRAFPSMSRALAKAAKQGSGSFSFPMWDVS